MKPSPYAIPVLGFVAASGMGKTSLLEKILPQLVQSGLRVGVIKHSHHHFEIDYPQKDSYRLCKAGASTMVLVSASKRAIIEDYQPPMPLDFVKQLSAFDKSRTDLILVEGFSDAHFPKIELHRVALKKPFRYPHDADIIALASDTALNLPPPLRLFDLNHPMQISHYILHEFLA